MTTMNKITEQEIKEYVSELGEFETEHRRGGTFYATASYTLREDDIKTLAAEGVDASGFLNVAVVLSGIYDDDNGSDWYSITYFNVEEYQELVPEQVIPAHYIKKQKTTEFKPVWDKS